MSVLAYLNREHAGAQGPTVRAISLLVLTFGGSWRYLCRWCSLHWKAGKTSQIEAAAILSVGSGFFNLLLGRAPARGTSSRSIKADRFSIPASTLWLWQCTSDSILVVRLKAPCRYRFSLQRPIGWLREWWESIGLSIVLFMGLCTSAG